MIWKLSVNSGISLWNSYMEPGQPWAISRGFACAFLETLCRKCNFLPSGRVPKNCWPILLNALCALGQSNSSFQYRTTSFTLPHSDPYNHSLFAGDINWSGNRARDSLSCKSWRTALGTESLNGWILSISSIVQIPNAFRKRRDFELWFWCNELSCSLSKSFLQL